MQASSPDQQRASTIVAGWCTLGLIDPVRRAVLTDAIYHQPDRWVPRIISASDAITRAARRVVDRCQREARCG